MKPHVLSVQAFGPYLGHEEIDFRQLDGRLTFLIAGNTGAGKSSILDAICFALYGDSSGAERSSELMRSKGAPDDLETEVSFHFSLGATEYSIQRSPRQQRPKKRGDGFTEKPAAASLIRHEPDGRETPLAGQPNKVDIAIEELVGFNVTQFRQVVVLPQGEFRRFLATNSREREDILKQLFKTERFLDAEKALKDHAATLEQQHGEQNSGIKAMLDSVGAVDMDALELQATTLEAATVELESKVGIHRTALKLATEALGIARRNNEKLDALDKAKKKLSAIDSTAEEFKSWEQQFDLATRAARLEAPYRSFEESKKRQAELVGQEKTAGEEARLKAEHHELVSKELEHVNKTLGTIEELATRIAQLEQTRTSVSGLNDARSRVATTEKSNAQATSLVESTKKKLTATDASLGAARKRLDELRANIETTTSVKAKGTVLAKVVEDHQTLANTLTTIQSARSGLDQARQKQSTLETRHGDAVKKHAALQSAREQGNAVLLARELSDDEPCPVCGSTTHPKLADSRIDIPDAADIREAGEHIEVQNSQIRQCESDTARLEAEIKTSQGREAELTVQLGPDRQRPLSDLTLELNNLKASYREAQERETEIEETTKKISEFTQTLADQRTAMETSETDARARAVQLAEATTALASLLNQLPEELRTPGALESAISEATTKRGSLETALTAAREKADAAQNEKTGAAAKLKTLTGASAAAAKERETAETTWSSARTEAAFSDEDQYHAARLEDTELELLRKRIDDYRQERNEAKGALKAAKEDAAKTERVDVAPLVARETETNALHDTSNGQLSADRARSELLRKTLSDVRARSGSLDALRADYEAAQHVAKVAGGSNPQELSLHRYVLSVILDEVLDAASHRLRALSSGRYRLQRRITPGRKGTAGGLELDVHDEFTGYARPVATLSGGEGFQAALSLALGLAEVTQNRAGGIHLDTLFIDEGFGNLDPDALHAAINTLTGLNDGQRLIGIISHVPELKEFIDTRLVIQATDTGSTTRWELA